MIRAIALLVALIVLPLAAASAAGARSVPQDFFGANWDGEMSLSAPPSLQEQQFQRMATSGVETARASFLWDMAQPNQNGPFDFTASDAVVQMGAEHGITILPVVILAPDWARATPDEPFSPPKNPSDYANYLTALIGRYGPTGTFWLEHPELPRLPIRAWQIWNEPHLQFQWTIPKGADFAPGYVALLKAAFNAVHAADPGAQVVLAGLANNSPRYLKRIYKAGARGFFDIAAIHPYTAKSSGVITLVERFRKVMNQFHDGGLPVWITELGLPASKGKVHSSNFLQTTAKGMARFLSKAYQLLVRKQRSSLVRVSRVYWYTWASGYNQTDIFRFTGLFRYRGGDSLTAQPAYSSYVQSAKRYEGCTKSDTGACSG